MNKALAFAILLALAPPTLAQTAGTLTYSEDARSHASDEDIRVARRAYRAACQELQTLDYCECMTGGMAQSLAPADLRVATALLPHNLSGAAAPTGLDPVAVNAAQTAAAQFEPSCRASRR